jgi:hypothetical protein
VKVTPSGVEVQTGVMQTDGTWNAHELLHFDSEGNEPDASRRERLGFGPSPESTFHTVLWHSAPECQPWHIDEMPFAECESLFEETARKFRRWNSMNCEHSKIGEHYYIEKCPICGCENPNYNPTAAKERLQGRLPN